MNKTNILIKYLLVLIVCLLITSGVKAEVLELRVIELTKAGISGHGLPAISVHGSKGGYSTILTDKLTYYFTVKMHYPKNAEGPSLGTLKLENVYVDIEPTTTTKTYEITIPYKNPRGYNSGVDPIVHCNSWLSGQNGNKREKALNDGTILKVSDAYKATAKVNYVQTKKVGFDEKKTATATIDVPVRVRCIGLNRPVPRKKSVAKEHERRKAKHIESIELDLTAKPGNEKLIDGQICPTKAYLYGKIKSIMDIEGTAVFFGPGYISPITKIDLPKGGQRTVRATYPIDWSSSGTTDLAIDDKKPNTKKFDITLNISNKYNKVIKSTGKKTFTATCKKANAPDKQSLPRVRERVQ